VFASLTCAALPEIGKSSSGDPVCRYLSGQLGSLRKFWCGTSESMTGVSVSFSVTLRRCLFRVKLLPKLAPVCSPCNCIINATPIACIAVIYPDTPFVSNSYHQLPTFSGRQCRGLSSGPYAFVVVQYINHHRSPPARHCLGLSSTLPRLFGLQALKYQVHMWVPGWIVFPIGTSRVL